LLREAPETLSRPTTGRRCTLRRKALP